MTARIRLFGAAAASLAACGSSTPEAADTTVATPPDTAPTILSPDEWTDDAPISAADQNWYDTNIAPHTETVNGQTYDVDRRSMLASMEYVLDSATPAEHAAACEQHDKLAASGDEDGLRSWVDVTFSDQVDDLWGPAYTDITLWLLRQVCY